MEKPYACNYANVTTTRILYASSAWYFILYVSRVWREGEGGGQKKFAYGDISMFVKHHCHNEVFKGNIVGSDSNTFCWLLAIVYTKNLKFESMWL